jgi:hypothetical protein
VKSSGKEFPKPENIFFWTACRIPVWPFVAIVKERQRPWGRFGFLIRMRSTQTILGGVDETPISCRFGHTPFDVSTESQYENAH